ncbi:hypothetical protein Dsin_018197 [Dipteronia sinensis]|uniref:RRM domain-containing protein n=1 Tax=Dipteronia sinensis TaxID=43782 RepID=A0AAE0A6D3_9ROSI|nr:hypothetical protein Dsin_018197 [Dipteronia sinensis]
MIKNARERWPNSLGREGNQVKSNDWVFSRRRDYREHLFLVFIDNLNPKVFGRVRDVYLSSKKSSRRSSFAFIRFEMKEEAERIVNKVNGMHIFGWPIVSKIASLGWKKMGEGWKQRVPISREGVMRKGREGGRGCFSESTNQSHQSFVEVVKGKLPINHKVLIDKSEVSKTEVSLNMSWKRQATVEDWLVRSAVSVLKKFANFSSVNKRLSKKGISFPSTYLGDKSIMWCFDSKADREGFMRDHFFWNDCFTSISRWSEALIPQARLAWITISGAPMDCWEPVFFMKLGLLIGEPLWVEEDTSLRRRVDRGKLLILLPRVKKCSWKVNVKIEIGSFPVSPKEDHIPVSFEWLKDFLGLKVEDSRMFLNLLRDEEMSDPQYLSKVGLEAEG